MKYGLSEDQLREIIDFIKQYPEVEEAVLFGSRAIDTYKEASDVDIALKGEKVTASLAAQLKFDIEEDTYLPFFFDFVAYPTITNEALREHIDKKGVSIFQGGWRECRLGEVAEIICGATPSTSIREYWGNEIKWVTAKDISESRGYKLFDTERKISKLGVANSSTKILPANTTVLIARGATMGKSCMIAEEMAFNQTCYALIGKENSVIPHFLFYHIKNLIYHFINIAHGAIFNTIIGSSLRETIISLPSLTEQKAIASVLSSLDDKIDLLHRQNKTLEAMAETLFRQWFVEEAQDDWETAKIGDFVRTNISSITKDTKLKTIRYLDTGSMNEGIINSFQLVDLSESPSRARRIVRHNDVIISTVRPNQKHYGIIKRPEEDIIVSTGFCVITCEKINPHFIYIFLTTKEMTEYLHSIAEGSTSAYPSIKPSDIESLEFNYPPEGRLKTFSEYADAAWEKIEYNHSQIRTLEKLRDTLLPKLMCGEVRVDYPQ